jgi:hypothetical protein
MLSCSALPEIGSFDSKRKPFVLFLGPFRGSFFHQCLEWFLFVLFLSVHAFTHVSRSLHLGLIGCAENNALPIDPCRLKHQHRLINDHIASHRSNIRNFVDHSFIISVIGGLGYSNDCAGRPQSARLTPPRCVFCHPQKVDHLVSSQWEGLLE